MSSEPAPITEKAPSRIARLGRGLRDLLIFAFVVWQLFFLVFRGALDLDHNGITGWLKQQPGWSAVEPVFGPIDRTTASYGNWCGIEQGWSLFAGPVARGAKFLAARIEFADGTAAWVYSDNEPTPTDYFRVGGWRQRKLEDYLAYIDSSKLPDSEELPLWAAYARWSVQRWRAAHPEDARRPERVVLVARWIAFPLPDGDAAAFREPEITTIGTFTPEGKLQ